MGKISDAFEKARKEGQSPGPVFKPVTGGAAKTAEKIFPLPAGLGTPPSMNGFGKDLIVLSKPDSFEAEQFKLLRTQLLFPPSGSPPRTIMVTSTFPGDGKSFVAANLAVSIAQNIEEHVLLLDCDLRRPSVHERFGYKNVPGLSEYLSDNTPLSSLLLKTSLNKLSLLPGGKPPKNPSELLSSRQMSRLLEEVKTRYSDRYIIIDSPPPQLTAEAGALARQVDGILLVIKYGGTPRDAVADLVSQIGKKKILGVVVNWMDSRYLKYGGYGMYGKYYKREG